MTDTKELKFVSVKFPGVSEHATWLLPARFKPLKALGKGAFGQVMLCNDTENKNKQVAVKRVMNTFRSWEDGLGELREIKAMIHCHHPKIISLDDLLIPYKHTSSGVEVDPDFDDLYLVMPAKTSDVEKIIRTSKLGADHVTWIMFQLMEALAYLHATHIVHRDLKPENILVDQKVNITLIDLGLARELNNSTLTQSEYVMTRWYRAPEVIIHPERRYDFKVDVWSAGCVFVELITKTPMFPGQTELEMTEMMKRTVPDANAYLSEGKSSGDTTNHLRDYLVDNEANLAESGYPAETLDLLHGLLCPDPANRLTAEQALAHPAFAKWRPYRSKCKKPEKFTFIRPDQPSDLDDGYDLLRSMAWSDIQKYHSDLPAWDSLR